jgi:hypothetical protein
MTDQPPPYRFTDEDDFCLSARLLPDLNTGGLSDTLSITIEGSDEPQSVHVPSADVLAVAAGIVRAAGQQPAPSVVSSPAAPADGPSRRAGLRDEIAEALIAWSYRGKNPEHNGILETVRANAYDRADVVLALLYREWPWLRAEAEDTGAVADTELAELRARVRDSLRRADEATARAAAMERAMESTAADALKHRGCHRDLMAQCRRAERAEARVAVLEQQHTGIRADTLREAADMAERLMDERYGPDCSYGIGGLDVARELRRMADETQQQPAEVPCCSDPTCTCNQANAEGRCDCAKWESGPQADETQQAAPGTCGHRGPERHPCGREPGHYGYHRHVRDGDGWVSWTGELPPGDPADGPAQPTTSTPDTGDPS